MQKKRKREDCDRKRNEKMNKKLVKKNKESSENLNEINQQTEILPVKIKEKCGVCHEDLDSDAEDEADKNVGCDFVQHGFI